MCLTTVQKLLGRKREDRHVNTHIEQDHIHLSKCMLQSIDNQQVDLWKSCRYKVAGDLTQILKIIHMFVNKSPMSLVLDCIIYKDDPNYSITMTIHQCLHQAFIIHQAFMLQHLLSLCCEFYSLTQVLGSKPELPECGDDEDELADITNRRSAKLYMVSL